MWRRSATALLLLAAAGGGVMVGCGREPAPALRTVVLDIHYSRFSPSTVAARPGEVLRFVIRNRDPIPHELIVGDEAVQDHHENGTEPHHGDRPGEVSVAAGATAETTYTVVSPGRLLFGCHLPGHWAYGMRGQVLVDDARVTTPPASLEAGSFGEPLPAGVSGPWSYRLYGAKP
jgi:uncharacterized cupredoxin-like copper-binding protein